MNWKKKVFENFRLYAVTDLREEDPQIFEKVKAAYRGGADMVQLRSKNLSDRALYEIGLRFRKIADRFRKLFFVNDRVDLALAVGADGVHLGQEDLSMEGVRKIYPRGDIFIGKSTHSLAQALQAQKEGADYIGVGPVFKTPTKPNYQPVGLELIRQVNKRVCIPFVCIGGIDPANIGEVLQAGGTRVAAVRAVFDAPNVYKAAQTFRTALEEYGKQK